MARGTKGMARKTAREMLYRLMAAITAESWRLASLWTVSPVTRATLTGRRGRRVSRRVKAARERGTASSGGSWREAPSLAASAGRQRGRQEDRRGGVTGPGTWPLSAET